MQPKELLKAIKSVIDKKPTEFEAYQDYFDTLRLLGKEDKAKSFEHNLWLRGETARHVMQGKDPEQIAKFYELNKKTYLYMAQDDFHSFCIYMEWNRPIEKRFYQPRMHTLRPMRSGLQKIADRQLDLLVINQPKRTGKTTFGGMFFGAFTAGRNPYGSSLFTGAKNGLAELFMKGFGQLLDPKGEYLFYDIFPEAQLVQISQKENNIHLAKKKNFATIQCRGIHGDITGTTEATPDGILYMDDMVENEEEAVNIERLEKRYNEIIGDILGRRLEGCPIIFQGTNYSMHDPMSKLVNMAAELGWRYEVVKVPALDPITDESNFEIERDGKRIFTTEYYRNERKLLGENSIQWMAQFQQEPFDVRGVLYPPSDLRRYFELPKDEKGNVLSPDAIISICDPKEKGTDYAFLPIVYVYGLDYYIEDCICMNGAIEVVDASMIDLLVKYNPNSCLFESNSAGWRTAEKIQDEIKRRGARTHITTKRTTANKETKIITNSAWVKEHCLFKDENQYERGGDYWRMMQFLCSWNLSGKNKNDDVPDGISMLSEFAQGMSGARVEIGKRIW